MTIVRRLPAAFVLTGATALALAGVAQADPDLFDGTYTAAAGTTTATWTVTLTCATDGCTADITSTSGWSSQATLGEGQWTWTVDQSTAIVCDDGRTFPGQNTYTLDAVTLTGTVSGADNGECGDSSAAQASTPLTVTKAD